MPASRDTDDLPAEQAKARAIAFERLPDSQREIIIREGEGIRANLHSIRVAQGAESRVMFGRISYLELLAKLGQFLNEVEP